jgi:predicted PurR-regulated permease PerM
MTKKIILTLGGGVGLLPLLAIAADDNGIFGVLAVFGRILNYIIPVLVALATVYFIWGVIQYLISGDEDKRKKAKEVILYGLIGLFIIISFWGIIKLVSDTFGVGPERLNERAIPCIENEAAGITCD